MGRVKSYHAQPNTPTPVTRSVTTNVVLSNAFMSTPRRLNIFVTYSFKDSYIMFAVGIFSLRISYSRSRVFVRRVFWPETAEVRSKPFRILYLARKRQILKDFCANYNSK